MKNNQDDFSEIEISESLASRITIIKTSEDEIKMTVYIKEIKKLEKKNLLKILKQLSDTKNMIKSMKDFNLFRSLSVTPFAIKKNCIDIKIISRIRNYQTNPNEYFCVLK